MKTIDLIRKLTQEGYSLKLIARHAGMSYMDLYRSMNNNRPLSDEEEAMLRRFALVQPCVER